MSDEIASIVYTNHRGVTSIRAIRPRCIWFGEVSWHPGRQWLLDAHDVEKGERTFAMKGVVKWL